MPRGLSVVENFGKKNSTGGSGPLRLRLKDGESAIVRFLEEGDDLFYYYYYNFSHLDGKNGFKVSFPCLDQEDEGKPDPGAENDFPRRFRTSVNVIWRDAPVYEKDAEGKIVTGSDGKWKVIGKEDQVAVWEGGQNIFSDLAKKDAKWGGLGSRDAEVSRTGSGMQDTKYHIEPADIDAGKTELSEADKELAKNKVDLEKLARLDMTYDEVNELINKKLSEFAGGDDSDDSDVSDFLDEDPFKD